MAEDNIRPLAPWRKNSPFTKEEWAELQRWRDGETKDERENRLHRARYAKRLEKDPNHRKAERNAYRLTRLDREAELAARWNSANRDKIRAAQKRYYHRHKEKRLENFRAWVRANPERKRERYRQWMAANPGLNAFYSAKWREACRRQTPAWADMGAILAIYVEAKRISEETGIPHEVDHYYPLQGRTVSGLHVAPNLRIIPASENSKKRNHHPEGEI